MRAEGGFSTFDPEHEPVRIVGIRIVEHAQVRHKLDGLRKVLKRLVKASLQPVGRNIVTALRHPLHHANLGKPGIRYTDEMNLDVIARRNRAPQKIEFCTYRVRKNCLGNERFTARQESLACAVSEIRRLGIGYTKFTGEIIGIDELKTGLVEKGQVVGRSNGADINA